MDTIVNKAISMTKPPEHLINIDLSSGSIFLKKAKKFFFAFFFFVFLFCAIVLLVLLPVFLVTLLPLTLLLLLGARSRICRTRVKS